LSSADFSEEAASVILTSSWKLGGVTDTKSVYEVAAAPCFETVSLTSTLLFKSTDELES
jgi:hypothetical protein